MATHKTKLNLQEDFLVTSKLSSHNKDCLATSRINRHLLACSETHKINPSPVEVVCLEIKLTNNNNQEEDYLEIPTLPHKILVTLPLDYLVTTPPLNNHLEACLEDKQIRQQLQEAYLVIRPPHNNNNQQAQGCLETPATKINLLLEVFLEIPATKINQLLEVFLETPLNPLPQEVYFLHRGKIIPPRVVYLATLPPLKLLLCLEEDKIKTLEEVYLGAQLKHPQEVVSLVVPLLPTLVHCLAILAEETCLEVKPQVQF